MQQSATQRSGSRAVRWQARMTAGVVGYLVFVEFTSGVLQGYYIPLLTDIARHLGINDADVNWLEAGQLMLSAIAVPVLAKLGDLHGHRRMLLWSAVVVAVATIVLAFAQTFPVFLLAWAVQGVYAAWLPLQVALIYSRSRGLPDTAARTRRATGLIVAALQLGAIVGALSGGVIGDLLGDALWLVLLAPGVLVVGVVVVVWRLVPEGTDRMQGVVDSGGAALLTAVLLVVTGGLTFVRLNGAEQAWPWLVVAAGLLLVWPFVRYELRQPDPLVDFRVLRSSAMWPVQLTAGLFGVSVLGAQGPLSTFARTDPDVYGYGLGLSTSSVSLVIGAYVISMLVGASQFARVSRLTTPRLTLIGAAALVATGYLLLVPFHDQLGQVLAGMTVAGVGSGALVAALPAAAAAAAPAGRTAVATGLTNTTKVIGGMFASSVFALALAAGAPLLAGGVVGTAGSLTGYVTVWTICGTTALIAAVALVFVPRLAFADPEQTEDRAAAVREETAG
ncbi:MFS transporter [Modestobacter sp. VKM Ac-2979]|uniref:MFS transporter n=1 Tax=unclassified Modestobacter TaxID=2643866 RepID=UPI0022ABC32E|nr:MULTISPECIES: MFS transporter [unclassified Modestobacter]MCZ2813140.1 MFS transporter [Modestobacter sp. VKM Ac-2979]MCZ2842831.1 MFS transporter [Modestobacter sp. VKM Ac-2980]